jgi:hypothetical protein
MAQLAAMQWSRSAVLNLYRAALKNGRNLKFTDKQFYENRIREEFQKNCSVDSDQEKVRLMMKCQEFLKRNRLV